MGFRAALENSYKFIDEPLVQYRVNIGLSSRRASSVKGRLALRRAMINLRLDLARQRHDDLTLSAKKNDLRVIGKVSRQVLMYSILSAYYEAPLSIWKCFKKNPILTMTQGVSEVISILRALARVCFGISKGSLVRFYRWF